MDKLLKVLLDNYKNNTSDIFRASKYWRDKNKSIIEELKKNNSENFRSNLSNLTTGFSDSSTIDYRKEYNIDFIRKTISKIMYCFPFSSIFNQQVELTKKYQGQLNYFKNLYFTSNLETKRLLNKYQFNETVNFGCDNIIFFKKKISMNYLFMAQRFDKIKKFSNISNLKSHCEIGGGFGSFLNFILQNHKKIRKVLYIDMFPQIYFGTLYLKKIYNRSVIDYSQFLKNNKKLFSKNNKLEIIILPPDALKFIKFKFDSFHNAYSFQEMDKNQIKYYRDFIKKNSHNNTVNSFIFYQNKNENIVNFTEFKKIFFNFKFKTIKYQRLDNLTEDILLINQ